MKKKQRIKQLEIDLCIANAELKRKTEWLDKLLHTEVPVWEKAIMSKSLKMAQQVEELIMEGSRFSKSEVLIPFMERFSVEYLPEVKVKCSGVDEAIEIMKLFDWGNPDNDKHRGKYADELVEVIKKEVLISMLDEMSGCKNKIPPSIWYDEAEDGYERRSIFKSVANTYIPRTRVLDYKETIEQDYKQFKEGK